MKIVLWEFLYINAFQYTLHSSHKAELYKNMFILLILFKYFPKFTFFFLFFQSRKFSRPNKLWPN